MNLNFSLVTKENTGTCNFHILFLARSGSHMMVDALNHHPDLNVTHTDTGLYAQGNVLGHALLTPHPENSDKVILLTRNSLDRLKSTRTAINFDKSIGYHSKKPVTTTMKSHSIKVSQIEAQDKRNQDKRIEAALYKESFEISYEELTGNSDMREIPEHLGRKICAFIGVDYHPMATDYYKPTVREA